MLSLVQKKYNNYIILLSYYLILPLCYLMKNIAAMVMSLHQTSFLYVFFLTLMELTVHNFH